VALGPAIRLHLLTLVDELRRDQPVLIHNLDLAGMRVELLSKLRESTFPARALLERNRLSHAEPMDVLTSPLRFGGAQNKTKPRPVDG
jgi:hypothetical protein